MATILIIDDDASMGRSLATTLDMLGHRPLTVESGQAGLRLAHGDAVDLVITDLIMPDIDGFNVICELRRVRPAMPLIAMSGAARFSSFALVRMAQQLGADEVLVKPFTPAQLEEALASACARRVAALEPSAG